MRFLKSNPIFSLLNSYLVDSPQPANISYMWNFGSLLGICLLIQILTGVFLAMHYTPNVDLAFISVEHIMRDVNSGWFLRYTHANVASFFFLFLYFHTARGLYYSSYKTPRVLLWSIGVIILILTMAIAFLGYVLPYGQMSLWGGLLFASDVNNFLYFIEEFNINFCFCEGLIFENITPLLLGQKKEKPLSRINSRKRIGPHNSNIYSIIYGSLLGDGYAEKRVQGSGTRVSFYQEGKHLTYLLWLHQLLSNLGYCNPKIPQIQTRLGKNGIVRKTIRFNTWTYTSLNWIHDLWYVNDNEECKNTGKKNIKKIPSNIKDFLTPLALSIWLMDDGGKVGKSLKFASNSFSYEECLYLVEVLYLNFNIKASVQSAGVVNQYTIYVLKESMEILRDVVLPHIHPSMKYKII